MPKYICLIGIDGTGKSSQIDKLVSYLTDSDYKVLKTREPGTPLIPCTMDLRNYMLDKQYANDMTPLARELISQAIRSIHMDKVILPNLSAPAYDFIVQDRSAICGVAYGQACGHNPEWLYDLNTKIVKEGLDIYDVVIYFHGDVKTCLARAKQGKAEYKQGDVIEEKGPEFMLQVQTNFETILASGKIQEHKIIRMNIDHKNKQQVFDEMIQQLKNKQIIP